MKISVITVCRNAAGSIGYTIESFLAQRHVDKELVIVDGASTDGTREVVYSFQSELISFHSEPDQGIYDAMNKGLTLFSGDGFGFLNADDQFHSPSVLSTVAAALEKQQIAAGAIAFVNSHGHDRRVVREWRSTGFVPGAFKKGWIQPHPAIYARRSVANTVGAFDITYKIAGDYEWLLRAYEIHDLRCEVMDEIVVDMKVGGTSTAGLGAIWTNSVEPLRARRKWLNAGLVDYAFFAKNLKKLTQLRLF